MSRNRMKARDKVTSKMTKDGLVSHNAATGEVTRESRREQSFDLRGKAHTPAQQSNPRHGPRTTQHDIDKGQTHRRQTPASNNKNPESHNAGHKTAEQAQTYSQNGNTSKQSNQAVNSTVKQHSRRQSYKKNNPQYQNGQTAPVMADNSTITHTTKNQSGEKRLKQSGRLRYKDTEQAPSEISRQKNKKKRRKQRYIMEAQTQGLLPPIIGSDNENGQPNTENNQSPPIRDEQPSDNGGFDFPANNDNPNTAVEVHDNGTAGVQDAPEPLPNSGKLQFTPEESALNPAENGAAKPNKKLMAAQRKSDRANTKLEKARNKLPSKKKLRSTRVYDEQTGKAKKKLHFEKEVKTQGQHLKGPLLLRPVKAGVNLTIANAHRKIFIVENENVGVKAAHHAEMYAEAGLRSALRFHKTAPYRKAAKLEKKAAKKSIKLSYQKTLDKNPKLRSNMFSRMMQKRKIKRQYAQAAREARKAAHNLQKSSTMTAKITKVLSGFIKRNPKVIGVIVLALLLFYGFSSLINVFMSMGSGGFGAIIAGSYLAEDVDIDKAELSYTEWETDLQMRIMNIESEYSGYDEYRYTQNQYGDVYDWVEDIKNIDPLAFTITGEDLADGSFPYVYDRILNERLQTEYDNEIFTNTDLNELRALINFVEENIGEFSTDVTDYLTTFDRPLAVLYEMTSVSLISDDPDFEYDYDKVGDFVAAIEREVSERLRNRVKREISNDTESPAETVKSDKRVIDGYEEKTSLKIAGKFVVLAENPEAEKPYLVCFEKSDNPLNIVEYQNVQYASDYVEAMWIFNYYQASLINALKNERAEHGLPVQKLTAADCLPNSDDMEWQGKLIIVKPDILSPEYHSAEHQLAVCTGGFGSKPGAYGKKVYVKELFGGKECYYQRFQIAGIADPVKLPEWAVGKLAENIKPDSSVEQIKTENKNTKPPKKPKESVLAALDENKNRVAQDDASRAAHVDKTTSRKKSGQEQGD